MPKTAPDARMHGPVVLAQQITIQGDACLGDEAVGYVEIRGLPECIQERLRSAFGEQFPGGDPDFDLIDQQVQHSCAYGSNQVIGQKAPPAPDVFDHRSEHPQGEHVGKQVEKTPVHEHAGEYLPQAEVGSPRLVEGKRFEKRPQGGIRQYVGGQIHQAVDHQQVFGHLGQHLVAPRLEGIVTHTCFFSRISFRVRPGLF